ncbi:Hypothetical exported 24-amino acid repeat protein [Flavobacteriales bacterium ALC-1]|nr:Hypothetical exported 24-amino acid repeat protein [Flavobacteriales bacterium ALC-1]
MELIKPDLERIEFKRGDKKKATQLSNDKFTGFLVFERHSNGTTKLEYEWKNGREYGYQVEYYNNGQVKYYFQFDDFNEIGPSIAYWENGSIRHEEVEENGKWIVRQYNQQGEITYELKNGIKKGKREDYTI